MKRDKIVNGARIRLHPIKVDDIEMIRIWRNNESIRKWFIYNNEISPQQQRAWWEKYHDDASDCMFIIEVLSEKMPIGTVALYNIECGEKAEFGRMMIGNEKFHGLGYAVEAVRLIIQYAFEELKLKNVYLEVFEDNEPAIRVYEKAGFSKQEIKGKLVIMGLNRESGNT